MILINIFYQIMNFIQGDARDEALEMITKDIARLNPSLSS
jgi:hypothetical protein